MHAQQGRSAHHALGGGASAGSDASQGAGRAGEGRSAQVSCRTPLRHDQARHEPGLFPDAGATQGQGGDTCTCSAGASVALTVMAYNLKRAMKILGGPRMVEALA